MKKLQVSKMENLQGGIECGQMFQVLYMLYTGTDQQQAQYQSLCGINLQCTETYFGSTVTKTYQVGACGY